MKFDNKNIIRKIGLFFTFSTIFFFSGCTVTNDISYQERIVGIDLSKYSQQGFFITTGDFAGDYTSVSIIQVNCRSGISPEGKQEKKSYEDEIYRDRTSQKYKYCDIDQLIDTLVSDAKSKGANGLINLKIDHYLQDITVTGLAIKN